ncbi:peptide methionine sulfoxide reductase [Scleroderma citrinum]
MSSSTSVSTCRDSQLESLEVATFGGGCFWGVEYIFLEHYPPAENKGILKTSVGYTGGKESSVNPSYEEVCTGTTDHAEAIRIEFDPPIVSYGELVEFFYRTHDPTTINRQGRHPYIARPYDSSDHSFQQNIFTHSKEQRAVALKVTEEVQRKYFTPEKETTVTAIQEVGPWYDAEEYHQQYLVNNPSGYHCSTHHLHW